MNHLVIFDCDGTLVDSEIIACKVFPSTWAQSGIVMTEEEFIRDFVGTGSDAEIVVKTRQLLSEETRSLALKRFEAELEKNLKLVSGIKDLLNNLKHDSCVASNSTFDHVKKSLSTTGISHFFGERVFSAYQVKRPKPSPDLFLHAAETLGYPPERCIVIEDSPTGILAAKNAKMRVVGFSAGAHCNHHVKERLLKAQADLYCSTTAELQQIIGALS
jgi:HAD superfamily hydrolase (TIGR01509 family)